MPSPLTRRLALAVGLILGLAFLYGSVGVWIGVHQAVSGPRTPGLVRDEQCGYRNSCTGLFTSDDGSTHDHRVVVSGGREQTAAQRALYLPRIGTGLEGSIQSDDTAYVGPVEVSVAPAVAIGVVLSLLGLLFTLPYVLIAALLLAGRLRR